MSPDLFGTAHARLTGPLASAFANVAPDWRPALQAWSASPAGQSLTAFVDARVAAGAVVYPPEPFRALALTPLAQTRVVVIGQDPYHAAGQAEGLAFSVPQGVRVPPSLRNIFREIQRTEGGALPHSGSLAAWARRGVLLLNSSLTVEEARPAGHAGRGWEALTDALVGLVASSAPRVAFLLWGAHAQSKASIIQDAADPGRHLVLTANHPSPLSARRPPVPFIGCGHWQAMRDAGIVVDWSLD